jgi:hypothetical protein
VIISGTPKQVIQEKLAMTFFKLSRYNICTLNSEMKAKWRCCRG